MNILITGGTGFIGINLAKRLLEDGNKLTLVDNLITSETDKLKLISGSKSWEFIEHDVSSKLPITVTKRKFDRIYHLACPTGVPNLTRLSEEMILTCSLGTLNVLNLAKESGTPILYTSSSEVYGEPLEFPQKETYTGNADPVGLRSPYEEGKRFSESLCVMYFRKYKLPVKIVRIFNTYGPGMSFSDSRVIPNMLLNAAKNREIKVQGTGKQSRTFCYIDDLVDALITVMEKGNNGEVYNTGSDEELSIMGLANKILKITGSKSRITHTARPSHDHSRRMPDLSKLRKLGWRNAVPLEKGLALTYSSIK